MQENQDAFWGILALVSSVKITGNVVNSATILDKNNGHYNDCPNPVNMLLVDLAEFVRMTCTLT